MSDDDRKTVPEAPDSKRGHVTIEKFERKPYDLPSKTKLKEQETQRAIEDEAVHKALDEITVHACGGDCPKGGDHQWDGDEVTFEMMGCTGGSVTCSKCGMAAIDYDMLNGP